MKMIATGLLTLAIGSSAYAGGGFYDDYSPELQTALEAD